MAGAGLKLRGHGRGDGGGVTPWRGHGGRMRPVAGMKKPPPCFGRGLILAGLLVFDSIPN
jgi:hypothetical protein